MTKKQRRIAHVIGLISGLVAGLVAYFGESGPKSAERFILFTGGGLLGGYIFARVLVSSLTLDDDVTDISKRDK